MIKSNDAITYLKSHSHKKGYDTGYHTLKVGTTVLKGQRNPEERIFDVNYDFTKKRVLDLGCNRGGMLFEIQDKVEYAVGIDHDSNVINCCNVLRCHNKANNLNFYVHDLDTMNLQDLNLYGPFDIAFMLSMSRWLKKWKTYINWIGTNCKACLFETNGSNQDEQIELLAEHFNVKIINDHSFDDANKVYDRKLLLCTK